MKRTQPPTPRGASGTPDGVSLNVRRPSFDFAPLPAYWFGGNPWKTHFGTALMLVFPSGERFVVQGVQRYRKAVTDPKLAAEVDRFCAQEGFHSREHGKLNRHLFGGDFEGLARFERLQSQGLRLLGRILPARFQLALSASIEHLTSSFGHQALNQLPELEAMHPVARELLVWHAIEEMEHKSVAFDVHRAMGGSQATRIAGLVLVVPMVLVVTYAIFLYLLAADGRLLDARMWKEELVDAQLANLRRVLAGERAVGLLTALPRDVAAFLRPSFHPWDIDDRALLDGAASYDPIAALARALGATPAAVPSA